jgi:hypothetical protein
MCMNETSAVPTQPSRLPFNWVFPALFRPRATFAAIAAQARPVWLLPLLLLSLGALFETGAVSRLRMQAAESGALAPPDPANYGYGYYYYSPEQQAQQQEAQDAANSPTFIYIFPAMGALIEVWAGWWLVGGIVHLALTLGGGRGNSSPTLNVAAWALLPYFLRALVRGAAVLSANAAIAAPGISGFIILDGGNFSLYLQKLAGLLDIYAVWFVILMVLGAKTVSNLPGRKTFTAVILPLLLLFALKALLGFAAVKLGDLTVIRPFF